MRESEPGREVVLFVPLPHDLGQANDGRARVHRYRSRDLRLGRELHAFRARYGLTQDEVARVVATSSAATISQWEAGHKVPDGLRRERLRELLDGRLWPELRTGLLALTDDLFHRMAGQPFAPMLGWPVDSEGHWLAALPNIRLPLARGIAVDRVGNIYIGDGDTRRILRFDMHTRQWAPYLTNGPLGQLVVQEGVSAKHRRFTGRRVRCG